RALQNVGALAALLIWPTYYRGQYGITVGFLRDKTLRGSLHGARVQRRRAESPRPVRELGARSLPAQRVDVDADRRVGAQGRQPSEQQRALPLLDERRGQPLRSAHGHVPLRGLLGDVLEVTVAREDGRGGLCTPAGQAREAVGAVADEREPVRDRFRCDAKLLLDPWLVPNLSRAPIELDDPVVAHALRQTLVRGAHDHLLCPANAR